MGRPPQSRLGKVPCWQVARKRFQGRQAAAAPNPHLEKGQRVQVTPRPPGMPPLPSGLLLLCRPAQTLGCSDHGRVGMCSMMRESETDR